MPVSAPEGAHALVVSGGTGEKFDYTHFVSSEDERPQGEGPGTAYKVVVEDRTEGPIVYVPQEVGEAANTASELFDLYRRVRNMEKAFQTFAIGVAAVDEMYLARRRGES